MISDSFPRLTESPTGWPQLEVDVSNSVPADKIVVEVFGDYDSGYWYGIRVRIDGEEFPKIPFRIFVGDEVVYSVEPNT